MADRDQLLIKFIQVTACDPIRARTLLTANNWNLNRAISSHFSNDKTNSINHSEHVRAALPSKRLRLADDFQRTARSHFGRTQRSVQPFRNYSAEARVRQRVSGWPPAARRTHQDTTSARANLTDLFAPPYKILFNCPSFHEAKQYAREQKKWLIVNVQNTKDFDSHKLNRDTWSDETVQEIIQENCVFWQIEHSLGDGPVFCNLYELNDLSYPHIAFIDPATGQRLVSMSGFIEPEAFATKLIEFLERQQSTTKNAKPTKTGTTPTVTDLTASSLDPEMERAIALSIADSNVHNDSRETEVADAANQVDRTPVLKTQTTSHSAGGLDKVPPEPPTDDVDSLKVRVRFPSGKNIIRRFRSSETVACLFAFVTQVLQDEESDTTCNQSSFDILVPYPRKSLRPAMQKTFSEASLLNAQVIVKFTERT